MRISDWSSDVCSSDLIAGQGGAFPPGQCRACALWRREFRPGGQPHPAARAFLRRARPRSRRMSPAAAPRRYYAACRGSDPPQGPARPVSVELGHDEQQRTLLVDARSEEHTSELQSLMRISYAVFCLKKKKT